MRNKILASAAFGAANKDTAYLIKLVNKLESDLLTFRSEYLEHTHDYYDKTIDDTEDGSGETTDTVRTTEKVN